MQSFDRIANQPPKQLKGRRTKTNKNNRNLNSARVLEDISYIGKDGKVVEVERLRGNLRASTEFSKKRQAPIKKQLMQQPKPQPRKRIQLAPRLSQPPDLLGAAPSNSDEPLRVSTAFELDGYTAIAGYLGGMADPFTAPSGSVRVMDPFTTIPCEAAKYATSLNVPIYNGTVAADGSVAMLFRGDTFKTLYLPASIAANHAVTWLGGTSTNTFGSYTNAYYNRPAITMLSIRVYPTGEKHTITAYTYRIQPLDLITMYNNCIANTSSGLTTTQRVGYLGGSVSSEESMQLDVMAHSSLGTTQLYAWNIVNTERASQGFMGSCIWLYGLRSTDRVEVEVGAHAEFVPVGSVTGILAPVTAVSCTADHADMVQTAADAMTSNGGDFVADRPGADLKKKAMADVAATVQKHRARDMLTSTLSGISSAVTGDLWGVAKSVYSFGKALFSQRLACPITLQTKDGPVTVPAILDRSPHLLPQELAALSLHARANAPSLEEEKKEEAEVVTPTIARRPSLLNLPVAKLR